MTEALKLTIDRRDGLAVIYTDGYINNQEARRSRAPPTS